jgi:stage II sporulation protein M
MRHYFIAATLVFVTGLILGYFFSDRFDVIIQDQLRGLEGIAKTASHTDQPRLWLFIIIFINNLVKSVFSIYIGVLFGVFPLFFLLLNGMLLGYIGEMQMSQQKWMSLVEGILPHGILEIPAIIIACAYGIRFGMLMLQGVFSLISIERRNAFRAEVRRFMTMSVQLIYLLAAVLFVAAVIESTFTFWLLGK